MTTSEILINKLQETSKLLQLIHHRNKNQHRNAKWWEWLAKLKRSVHKLIQELQASDGGKSHLRAFYMKDILIPKCYVPFTQLVQDKQFSPLGLALVGELAKTRRTLDALDDEVLITNDFNTISAAGTVGLEFERPTEDVGESINREQLDSYHSHRLRNPSPVSIEAPAAKGLQPDSNPDADHNAAGKPRRPCRSTVTANSYRSLASSSAKTKAPKIHSKIIDQLFQRLA
ncbi:hypothetical protein MMC29_002254 [Sticta canariensis]|nr:hypothetical protein [Sticta canariensis]